jgi:nitrate/nitrite transport system ATP-binding protein
VKTYGSVAGMMILRKTTLVSLIAGLILPDAGRIEFDGAPVREPSPERGIVFQSYSLLSWMSVRDNVQLAVDAVSPGRSAAERRARAEELVRLVNLELSGLGKTYDTPSGPAVIVRDFTLRIDESEFICIIGHSGCGKSTVLGILMGLSEASEGGVILGGREVVGPGLDRGVVFQSPALLPWLSAADNVQLAVDQVCARAPRGERRQRALEALRMVGLRTHAECRPHELSAGMRQRVGIARALALKPKVLLLDEPFSQLDALTRMELQDELLRLWAAHRQTVVMVTHDVDEALLLADRVVMMTAGPAATVTEIFEVPLPRPRERAALVDDPAFYAAREHLLSFLEAAAARPDAEPQLELEAAELVEVAFPLGTGEIAEAG